MNKDLRSLWFAFLWFLLAAFLVQVIAKRIVKRGRVEVKYFTTYPPIYHERKSPLIRTHRYSHSRINGATSFQLAATTSRSEEEAR